ncbi:MAG: alpha/beta hydrolase [Planctomycetes bacterium]|nr:alpha/beta hydrolase [Planctomycetota bacterium]MBI3847095.1 alpha/beta hydrolase [Planctomycetota bacterium]
MSVAERIESLLLYRPVRRIDWQPSDSNIPFEEVRLRAEDGTALGAWFMPGDPALPTVLFFQGNKGNRGCRGDTIRFFHSIGVSSLVFDYRGYGDSHGRPSEHGLYSDARAAFHHLVGERGIDSMRIILHGRSLGAAVAIDLAAALRDGFAALLIECAFASLRDAAMEARYGRVLSRVVQSRFDSIGKVGHVRRPVLVTHGDRDRRIPIQHGRLLHARANSPKWFFEIDGVGHGDLLRLGDAAYRNRIREFLTTEHADALARTPH